MRGDQERRPKSLAGAAGVSQRGPGQLGTWPPCAEAPTPSGLTHTHSSLSVLRLVPGRSCRSGQVWASRGRATALLRAQLPCVCPQAGAGLPRPALGLSRVEEDKSEPSLFTPHPLLCPSGARCSSLCASSHEVSIKMPEHPFAHSPSDAETHLLPGGTASVWVGGTWSG